jgi:hypothetical protein
MGGQGNPDPLHAAAQPLCGDTMHEWLLTPLLLLLIPGCSGPKGEQTKPNDSNAPASQDSGWTIQFDVEKQPWESVPLELDTEIIGTARLEFARRPTHPFLAEYDRKVSFVNGSNERTSRLAANTGGRTRINVYHHKTKTGDYLRLHDQNSEHLIDLSDGRAYYLLRVKGRFYIGEVNPEEHSVYGIGSDSEGNPKVEIFGNPAQEFKAFDDDDDGKYVGCIVVKEDGVLGLYDVPEERLPKRRDD